MAREALEDRMEGGLGFYELPVGHETEDPVGHTENYERTAVTSGVGFVRQQGAPAPTVYKVKGWAPKDQIEELEAFYNASAGIGTPARTLFWRDISGTVFEVIITAFDPERKVGRWIGRGEQTNYVFQYTLTLEVV